MLLHLITFFVFTFIYLVQCDRPYFDIPSDYDEGDATDSNENMYTPKETRCKEMPFHYLSKYRRFSSLEETWEDANACCILRGMVLHTPEKADEEKSLKTALSDAEKELSTEKPYWTSGKWNDSAGDYTWFYGKPAGPEAVKNYKFQREKHSWLPGQELLPSEGLECVAIEYNEKRPKFLTLTKRNCEEKRRFICQNEPQRSGHDLNLIEVEKCKSLTLDDYDPLPNGMFLKRGRFRWKAARYCCEHLGMTLLGNFMEEKKHRALFKGLQGRIYFHTIYDNGIADLLGADKLSKFRFWTSLNDHCTMGKWEWMCGDHDKVPEVLWRSPNPDNYNTNEDCGEFKWLEKDNDTLFSANDLSCDFSDAFICEKTPACVLSERWKCTQPPRKIDITEPTPVIDVCTNISWINTGNTSDFMYLMSDKRVTWLQAKFCLKILNCTQGSFKTKEDIDFFTEWINSNESFRSQHIWTPATTYEKKITTDLTWPDNTLVSSKFIHKFHTHDDITPICGKIAYFDERVAIMTENCVEPQYFVCKRNITLPLPPDPFKINETTIISPPCAIQAIGIDINAECPDSETTVQRPNASQIELTKSQMTEEELHKLRFQNRKLLETVVSIGIEGKPFLGHKPKYGFRLYGLAAAVYVGQCPDVPRPFVEDVLYYFHRLHYYTSQARTEFLDVAQYAWIKKLMERCLQAEYTNFRTDECGEWVISTDNCTTNFICPDPQFQFNITRHDPLVEIWWKIFELSHAVCFQYFHESYRMFHLYSKAVMDLFSNAMRLRMEHQIEPSKFWERVLGPQYELYLINMDRCNEAVIKRQSLPYRLPYSTLPARVRIAGAPGNPLPKY